MNAKNWIARLGALSLRSAQVATGPAAQRRAPHALGREISTTFMQSRLRACPTSLLVSRPAASIPAAAISTHAAVRNICTTAVCRASLDDFYQSRPPVDKDGNPAFPAAGRAPVVLCIEDSVPFAHILCGP
jgi:hypothetical protein